MSHLLAALMLLCPAQDPAPTEAARSLFTAPLYLTPEPPECRAAAVILVASAHRRPAGAAELAAELARRLRAGEDFALLARSYSDGPQGSAGGVLGALPPGVLEEAVDRFLFAAEIRDVSAPLASPLGLTLWTRIERWAASEHVLIRGTDEEARARADELAAAARTGTNLKRAAAAAGLQTVRDAFERGAHDRLLKLATFECPPGDVFGPLVTPLGFVVGQRIPVEDVAPARRQNNWIRARALVLLTPDDLSDEERAREYVAARKRIERLHARAVAGESLEALAREHTAEPTARARAGDLGWIHRESPTRSRLLDGLFVAAAGEILAPIAFQGGWVLLGRTR